MKILRNFLKMTLYLKIVTYCLKIRHQVWYFEIQNHYVVEFPHHFEIRESLFGGNFNLKEAEIGFHTVITFRSVNE